MYKTREEIENWLEKMNVTNYVINEDLTVDVNESVEISYKELKEIPIRFGKVNGYFDCSNNNLITLDGCSQEVNGGFDCSCNKLTSLKGCPEVVYGSFFCRNNELTSLENCLEVVSSNFNCSNNKLTDFKYFPQKIHGNFIYINNNKIKEEELVNFNCEIKNAKYIYGDFNEDGNKEEFLEKVKFYQNIKKENELLKELSANSNNVKLNKKL